MEELKSCPFCGDAKPFLANRTNKYPHLEELDVGHCYLDRDWFVICFTCGAQGPYGHDYHVKMPSGEVVKRQDGKQTAIDGWNRRAAE